MATDCEVTLDRERLKKEIRATYGRVAEEPDGDFHFHRGPDYAATLLGYDRAELDELPDFVTAPFAGVGNPFRAAALPSGARVIDLGSGSGMDCLLAARQVGPRGEVIGFDFTDAMLRTARTGAATVGIDHARFERADIAELPLEDASVDVAISNGVINLSPEKDRVFAELYRVLRPGGRVQFSDIVIEAELSAAARNDIELWVG
ncbi:SAM-dependent methyltransferase (UbiE-like) [Thioalkalivibrio nitratireducens DSM 14787]|uniref:Arsenite methyltransferase n=1 Tax=Thioalkalivibrio nitratireducens (strain DSM 14787 / UNIQEM 213 / ALEN2) TaxID=1255043 RepID=L0DS72_THIND|nr:methyltransferase domain-containing protein [Thioalkalivibrio nitratireducens]AGA31853.1 SAM-dependent methyltransferase (UbiE-like) [Thioalkalivibrio nitratireducens DSM 14787]